MSINHPMKWDRPTEAVLDDPELEGLVLRLHACVELAEFWSATRATLDALLPSDASVMYVNFHNFAKSCQASRVFFTPKADKPVDWLQSRRLADFMPPYILDRPNLPMFRLSDVCSDPRELEHSEYFGKYMEPDGWRHCACLLFWRNSALHSEITLWRRPSQGDFTATEMALLSRFRPHFSTVLDRLVNARRMTDPIFQQLQGDGGVNGIGPRSRWAIAANDTLDPAEARIGQTRKDALPQKRLIFSDKERAALQLVACGVSNGDISKRLGVTVHTVKWHLANIYQKLGVKNRTAAVRAALALDLA